ncbi:MAG: cytochrome c biogenesis protein CcsA [Gammaproteobacteria bacterium]|nr:cytochrome c biogenesis protein CcsA [Gammaproteobacteria bacterium]
MNTVVVGVSTTFLYSLSAILLALRLWQRQHTRKLPLLLPALLALALHALHLYQNMIGAAGLQLSFFSALSLFSWIIVALMLMLSVRQPVENLGIGLLPLTALAVLSSLAFDDHGAALKQLSEGLQIHILVSVLAYSMLSLAALQALLFSLQNRNLHNHHPGGFIRALPPLYLMEVILFQMINIGFILLSFSLLSGFLYLEDMFAQHIVHKTILSLFAWGMFATLLIGRRLSGWRGKLAVRWTLSAAALLMLAYFGSKLVQELILA